MKADCLVTRIAGITLLALLPVAKLSAETAADVPPPPPIECTEFGHTLFLAQGNVILRNLRWRLPQTGQIGCGTAVPHLQDTGHFWFFGSENLELTCKVIDGRAVNQKYWVFCGALTDVEWWVEARNNANPELPGKSYYNPPGQMASFADVSAISPGANTAPLFPPGITQCGAALEAAGLSGDAFSVRAKDPDGDPLTAQVHLIQGDGSSVMIRPKWENPIDGSRTEQGVSLEFGVSWPNEDQTYVFAVEASDGRSLSAPFCTVTLRVWKFPR